MSAYPNWTMISSAPGAATCKKLVSCDSIAYGLFDNGEISKYYPNSGFWAPIVSPTIHSSVVGLSGASDSTLMALTSDGSAYINIYGFWYPIDAYGVTGVGLGGAQAYATAENGGRVVRHSYGTTALLSSASGPTKLSATSNLSDLWGMDNFKTVYRWVVSHWEVVPGCPHDLVDIHLSHSSFGQLQVFAVDYLGHGWMYTNGGGWLSVLPPGGMAKFKSLEGGPNHMWAVTTDGELYSGSI